MDADKMNVDQFADYFMSRPVAKLFAVIHGSWWMYELGFWVPDLGGVLINHAIIGEVEEANWAPGRKQYIHDRVRHRLRAQMTRDRLPGRLPD